MNDLDKKELQRLKAAYYSQKTNATRIRGLEWGFTFESWLEFWISSGKLEQRGKGNDQYCMARNDDLGGYTPENITIKTNRENHAEAVETRKRLDIDLSKPRNTKAYYLYEGIEFSKQYEIADYLDCSLRYVSKLVSEGKISKMMPQEPTKIYLTPWGGFGSVDMVLDVIERHEGKRIVKHALYWRIKTDKPEYRDFSIEVIENKPIIVNGAKFGFKNKLHRRRRHQS